MKTIKITLDFMNGPIWKDELHPETYERYCGVDIIDNDEYIQKLNLEIQELYSSYYHFDDNTSSFIFDIDAEKNDKFKLLNLLNKLINRLNELNDGTFRVDDRETDRIKNL